MHPKIYLRTGTATRFHVSKWPCRRLLVSHVVMSASPRPIFTLELSAIDRGLITTLNATIIRPLTRAEAGRPLVSQLYQPVTQLASHQASQPASQHQASQPASQHQAREPATKPASQPASTKPASQPASTKPASQPAPSQRASHQASGPAINPASQPATKPSSQPPSQHQASEPATKPESQPPSQVASHQASEPATKPESQPPSQVASHQASEPAKRRLFPLSDPSRGLMSTCHVYLYISKNKLVHLQKPNRVSYLFATRIICWTLTCNIPCVLELRPIIWSDKYSG